MSHDCVSLSAPDARERISSLRPLSSSSARINAVGEKNQLLHRAARKFRRVAGFKRCRSVSFQNPVCENRHSLSASLTRASSRVGAAFPESCLLTMVRMVLMRTGSQSNDRRIRSAMAAPSVSWMRLRRSASAPFTRTP